MNGMHGMHGMNDMSEVHGIKQTVAVERDTPTVAPQLVRECETGMGEGGPIIVSASEGASPAYCTVRAGDACTHGRVISKRLAKATTKSGRAVAAQFSSRK